MPPDYRNKVLRMLAMVALVRSGRHTPQSLAAKFGVTDRTIHRDRDVLEQIGFRIMFDHEENAYRLVEGDALMPPVSFEPEEALAIAAMVRQLEGSDVLPDAAHAARGAAKILAAMPNALLDEVQALTEPMGFRTSPTEATSEIESVHRTLIEAMDRRVKVECTYEPVTSASGTSAQSFLLEPWAVFFIERAWYVVGLRSDRDAPRTLKLSRFTRVRPTDERATRPEDFSLEQHLGNAWRMMNQEPDVDVEILFRPGFAATAAETRWHRTQDVEEHDDGSATFRFTVAGLDEIQWWILSMGPGCRVVSPPELAERVRTLARETAEQYDA